MKALKINNHEYIIVQDYAKKGDWVWDSKQSVIVSLSKDLTLNEVKSLGLFIIHDTNNTYLTSDRIRKNVEERLKKELIYSV